MTTVYRVSFFDIADILGVPPMALLDSEMDRHIQPYLFACGIDTNRQVIIQACQHRCKKFGNKPVIGYTYLGQVREDKEWLHSPRCSLETRIAAQKDVWLRADMMVLSQRSQTVETSGKGRKSLDLLPTEIEENADEVLHQIEELVELQKAVRGIVEDSTDCLDGL